ncbi:hypothetical protein N7539_002159 [Penicillium diatomitis]|uniref:Uncharacterized protein n=1 Tax=Penicillium diatomitis TaxID=2819901 RepID=A0A9W9XI37_9EURO|nr:uncharacterized protein N7539_002159 [Penicillium diatomitis]KAJ5493413.1 hypothetical protein N7539_002159 [Penicillium diatomitis]
MSDTRGARQARPTRPVRSTRARIQTYHEDSSSEEEIGPSQNLSVQPPTNQQISLRPRTATGKRRVYREETSDTDSSLSSFESDPNEEVGEQLVQLSQYRRTLPRRAVRETSSNGPPTVATRHAEGSGPSNATRSKRRATAERKSTGNKGITKPPKKRGRPSANENELIMPGVIPPWSTLPYQVLFDIFLRASHPIVDEQAMQRSKSVKWLLDVGLLCRSFLEPALAALFHAPPLVPPSKSFGLLSLLSRPQTSTVINYPVKVKELHVEAESVLLYKGGPRLGWFNLSELIALVPEVKSIRLFHKDDHTIGLPHYHVRLSKWQYPESLFHAMDESGTTLRHWDWNGRFMDSQDILPYMFEKHQRASFQQLKHLRLLHIGVSSPVDVPDGVDPVSRVVNQLQHLQTLELIECPCVDGKMMSGLPKTLRSLTITNCDSVFSSCMDACLKACGQGLQELNLRHNRHLNMSFATNLAHYCPNLQTFRMDISIRDWSSYHDTEPHFDVLLAEQEKPTWPGALQEIELLQLRRLTGSTAESFFVSLVDAGPNMPDLRRLTITAMVKLSWRDRANFREKWIRNLESTFQRYSAPPDPNRRSLRKRTLKPSQPAGNNVTVQQKPGDCESSAASKRQSSRLAQRRYSASHPPHPQGHEHIRQGMCDVVNIRIDNQRPTDTQFKETDFLDDELSGDEDWTGDDWEPAERHAW